MSALYLRSRIPDGSRLQLSIVEADGTPEGSFVGSARLVLENGEEQVWDDKIVHPGPRSEALVSPRNYVWRVWVQFTSAAVQTAIIRAVIHKPDGQVFSTPYAYEVSGTNGELARATVVAVTALVK